MIEFPNGAMSRCDQEMCPRWDGEGCPCAAFGIDRDDLPTSGIYTTAIAQALAKGDVRPDLDPRLFAFFLDNLLMSLQFSYTCDYYKERFKFYTGVDVEEMDEERVIGQLLKFVESAFTFEKK